MLIPFLGAPQTFMHCAPCGALIENFQSNPTQSLFVEGVFMTDKNDPSSSQKPNLVLMFFRWYWNILFIIESFRKKDFNLQMPYKYDCHSHRQCQLFTPTTPTSISTSPSYPAVFFFVFQAKTDTITQWIRQSHYDPTPFHNCVRVSL
ncbi:hypothetical protein O181_090977 [Austropuccinia psidii MF-1]|uniref:Uncharacterized protein n=1 Tax=Austropuccinia psidii MF-1 TaxID=1389203 RepID=A0A9Q3IWE2_9BASI|nr:hypothetical protein [Austropuccinia psidii MF-1]